MYCPICKQEIKDNSKFCGKCGKKIPRCPSCGRVADREDLFCVYDGTPLFEGVAKVLPEKVKKETSRTKKKMWIPIVCVITLLFVCVVVLGYNLYYNEKIDLGINKIKFFDKERTIENRMIYISGENPSDTSIVVAERLKESWKLDKFDAMIIVDENGTSATFNAGYLAKENNAPILLIDQDNPENIINYIKQNINDEGRIYVLGSVNSMIQELEEKIPNVKMILLSGKNRYETNTVVLQQTDILNKEILVCCDNDYGIGLSASATGKPVLLVGTTLTDVQKKLLSDNSCELICIGCDDDFNSKLIEELENYDEEIEYIKGNENYEVIINIANRFFDLPNSFVLVHEDDYANSLCGAPLAFEYNAPFLLLNDNDIQCVIDYVRENSIETGYILENSDLSNKKIIDSFWEE